MQPSIVLNKTNRKRAHQHHCLPLLVLLVAFVLGFNGMHAVQAGSAPAADAVPITDGAGVLPKPSSPTVTASEPSTTLKTSLCETSCVTPFGVKLGEVDSVIAYSNCQSSCVRPEYSFMDLQNKQIEIHQQPPSNQNLHYVGLIYQCVEYARRWWMSNAGITFGSIDSAYEIFYLSVGKNIYTQEEFSISRSVNGTAKRRPQRGDLLVYYPTVDDPNWRHGHVAVIVAVDEKRGLVSLAEQNYRNREWQSPLSFSRQIPMFKIGGRYQLLDVDADKDENHKTNSAGGVIAGWVYPTLK